MRGVSITKCATLNRDLVASNAHAIDTFEDVVACASSGIKQSNLLTLTDIHNRKILEHGLRALGGGEAYGVKVGEGVEVIARATKRRQNKRCLRTCTTHTECHRLAINGKGEVAGIGADADSVLIAGISLSNQAVEVGCRVILLRDNHKGLVGCIG